MNSTLTIQLPLSVLQPVGTKLVNDKLAALGGAATIGASSQPRLFPDGISYLQDFGNSIIFYNPAYGAISIDKAIYGKWSSPAVTSVKTASGDLLRDYLGFPVSDSFKTAETGGSAAYFERGMIAIRGNGQAFVISGPIYEKYRRLGDISSTGTQPVVGLPISDEEALANNGRCVHFESGDIYWSAATDAREIHGAIRERWLVLGGATSVLGLPISDECGVMNGNAELGRFNRFANGGCIYWTAGTGAWDVYGAIYSEWSAKGGPLGPLGFPISGETSTPSLPNLPFLGNVPQGRFNDFQRGVIVWYPSGDYAGAHTVQGLQLYAQRYECNEDFNVQINIEATPANPPNINHGRMPSGGNYDAGGKDLSGTILLTVPLVQSNTQVSIWMLCIHEKTIGKDDEEGTVTANYNILNLWGLQESNHAHQNGAFTATFEMQPDPLPPVSLDPDQFRTQLFWPFQNIDVDQLSWRSYSDTFADVAETDKHIDLNPFSFKLHLFEIAFYNIVYQSLGQPGLCFGFSLESIYARENRSLFIEPIYTQNSYHKDGMLRDATGAQLLNASTQTVSPQDAEVVNEASIKHGYQVGASFIEWFLGKWVTGGLHQPIDGFYASRDSFNSNDWPVISISSSSDLSSDGHVIVPYKWSPPQGGNLTIWVGNINDPASGSSDAGNNDPGNTVTITPTDDSYSFDMHPSQGVAGVWFGSPNTGGRFLPIPYSKLNSQPVTPGDAIFALIVGGVLIICGGDAKTSQITDEHGNTFYSAGSTPANSNNINGDPKTKIPQMALIPIHDGGLDSKIVEQQQKLPPDFEVPGRYPVRPVARNAKRPEIYYLHREEMMTMEAKSPLEAAAKTAPPSAVTETLVRREPLAEARFQQPSTLTFAVEGQTDGSYDWAILTPRMSASISAQCAAGASDTIRIDAVNGSDQGVTFSLPAGAAAKTVHVAVGGYSGNAADRRWYELLNLNLSPGQTISAQVNNRGGELLLQNSGPALTCELRVHYGMDTAGAAVRPSVVLDANMAFHIAPQEWSAVSITKTPVQMTVFDPATGSQTRKSQL